MFLVGLDEQIGVNAQKQKRAELLRHTTISYEEYKQLHSEGNAIYLSNKSAIEDFYHQNTKLYAEISMAIDRFLILLSRQYVGMLNSAENQILRDKIKAYNLG
jgi:hypothetical protein